MQMMLLFARSTQQDLSPLEATRHQRLTMIQPLSADFSGMIHAHQSNAAAAFGCGQPALRHKPPFIRAGRVCTMVQTRPEQLIGHGQQRIETAQASHHL
jgi:hypothetical protein